MKISNGFALGCNYSFFRVTVSALTNRFVGDDHKHSYSNAVLPFPGTDFLLESFPILSVL